MNDLISRQALCEYALNQKNKSVTPNDIMRFPSALHWIPCSERLPKYSGTYLVTLVDEGQTWGDTCEWNSTFGGRWQDVFDGEYRDVSNVIAWMPLPEPYKERREE